MTLVSAPYVIRAMTVEDIPRVSEIERESFPTMWPQTAYKRELQHNNLAAYIVLSEHSIANPQSATSHDPTRDEAGPHSPLHRFLRSVFGHAEARQHHVAEPAAQERIVGFVGCWFMVDEAHIVTIAVAERERRRGLGELLLIAAIELAQRRGQETVTLECRVTNLPAQALYDKYGFRRVGVRKRYYTDNNEDALIMTTPPIQAMDYQERFQHLRAEHAARHGVPRVLHPELS